MSMGRCLKILCLAGLLWWVFNLGENHQKHLNQTALDESRRSTDPSSRR